mmetsp:Transcript_7944/g.26492  ORF Transcript_7944/g.26492 Transcript_7944/m.26492 type:complete len:207 (-) Transcript_7944:11-631(-)
MSSSSPSMMIPLLSRTQLICCAKKRTTTTGLPCTTLIWCSSSSSTLRMFGSGTCPSCAHSLNCALKRSIISGAHISPRVASSLLRYPSSTSRTSCRSPSRKVGVSKAGSRARISFMAAPVSVSPKSFSFMSSSQYTMGLSLVSHFSFASSSFSLRLEVRGSAALAACWKKGLFLKAPHRISHAPLDLEVTTSPCRSDISAPSTGPP